MFDYSKLHGRIREKFKTQAAFAEKMHLSERTVSLKLNQRVEFSQKEIVKAADILQIEDSEIHSYFFTSIVQKR